MTRTCTKCGNFNKSGLVYCKKCGHPLFISGAIDKSKESMLEERYPLDSSANYINRARNSSINGLALLSIGLLLSLTIRISSIAVLGYVLIVLGSIFIFMNRDNFSRQHDRNVSRGFVLVILSIVLLVLAYTFYGIGITTSLGSIASLNHDFYAYIVLLILSVYLLNLGSVLYTLDLQRTGLKYVLYFVLVLVTIFSIMAYVIMIPLIPSFSNTVKYDVGTPYIGIGTVLFIALYYLALIIPEVILVVANIMAMLNIKVVKAAKRVY